MQLQPLPLLRACANACASARVHMTCLHASAAPPTPPAAPPTHNGRPPLQEVPRQLGAYKHCSKPPAFTHTLTHPLFRSLPHPTPSGRPIQEVLMLLEAYKQYSKYATQALKAANLPKNLKGHKGDIPMNARQQAAMMQVGDPGWQPLQGAREYAGIAGGTCGVLLVW